MSRKIISALALIFLVSLACTPRPQSTPVPTPSEDTPANVIAWSPDGQWLAVAQGSKISILDASNFQLRTSFLVDYEVMSLVVSPDDRCLAVGMKWGGLLQLLDTSTWEPIFEVTDYEHANPGAARSIDFSPDGRLLAYTAE